MPKLSFSKTLVNVSEGDPYALFTVNLDSKATSDVTFSFYTEDGTAQAGQDYYKTTGSAKIKAGKIASIDIQVNLKEDTTIENSEGFYLKLRDVKNADVRDATAYAIIADNDKMSHSPIDTYSSNQWDLVSGEPKYFGYGGSKAVDSRVIDFWSKLTSQEKSDLYTLNDSLKKALFGSISNHTNTSGYLYDKDYYNSAKNYHSGIDYDGYKGDIVRSPISGTIIYTGNLDVNQNKPHNYGVVIDDDKSSNYWILGHLNKDSLAKSGHVDAGKTVVGKLVDYPDTKQGDGDHLHVEVQVDWDRNDGHIWGYNNSFAAAQLDTVSPLEAYHDYLLT